MVVILKDNLPVVNQNLRTLSGELYNFVSITLTNLDFTDTALYSCNATNQLASFQRRMTTPQQYTIQCKPTMIAYIIASILSVDL